MNKPHTHVCAKCAKPYECDGTLERNDDGFPEVICLTFHQDHQQVCETCHVAADAATQADLAAQEAAE